MLQTLRSIRFWNWSIQAVPKARSMRLSSLVGSAPPPRKNHVSTIFFPHGLVSPPALWSPHLRSPSVHAICRPEHHACTFIELIRALSAHSLQYIYFNNYSSLFKYLRCVDLPCRYAERQPGRIMGYVHFPGKISARSNLDHYARRSVLFSRHTTIQYNSTAQYSAYCGTRYNNI